IACLPRSPSRCVESDRHGVASAEVDDVAILQKPLVDFLVVDVRAIGRIPIDQQYLAIDGDDLGMKPGHLRILQYDLTNRRLPPDSNTRSAEAQTFSGAGAVEDGELPQHQRPARRHAGR